MMAYQNVYGAAAANAYYPQMQPSMGGNMLAGSTPNLLNNGNPEFGMLHRGSTMTLGQQQQQAAAIMAEPFLDSRSKARIDAWRQGVHMD
jgi:hypothetical protein